MAKGYRIGLLTRKFRVRISAVLPDVAQGVPSVPKADPVSAKHHVCSEAKVSGTFKDVLSYEAEGVALLYNADNPAAKRCFDSTSLKVTECSSAW